jgi:hypothetical protein
MSRKRGTDDYRLESSMFYKNVRLQSSGRSKRNIPLPIFKNEPMGKNNEYTCKE